jgi:hypothetical protein
MSDLFIIAGSHHAVPEARWTLKDAQSVLERKYSDYRGSNLNFEPDDSVAGDTWKAYDFHDMDAYGHATQIPETIVRIEVPDAPGYQLPEGVSAVMEMRVITRAGVTSMRNAEGSAAWDMMDLGRGHIIEQFAARAGRALADYVTKGEPR